MVGHSYILHTVSDRYAAEKIVKVPQMAESITEDTLKQFAKSKQAQGWRCIECLQTYLEVGDYVEQDEEIATIETDKASSLPTSYPPAC